MLEVAAPLLHEFGWWWTHLQAQQILDLPGEDDHGDAGREPGRDRKRNELDRPAQAGEPEAYQHQAGHQGSDGQPLDAVALDDPVHDHHECPRGTADLHPGATQRGNDEAGDDGRHEAGFGGDATGDRKRDRQWKRDDPDDDAGPEVGDELGPGVVSERGGELGDQHGHNLYSADAHRTGNRVLLSPPGRDHRARPQPGEGVQRDGASDDRGDVPHAGAGRHARCA